MARLMNTRSITAALLAVFALSSCNDHSRSGPDPAAVPNSPATVNDTDGLDDAGRDNPSAQAPTESPTSPNPKSEPVGSADNMH